MKKIKMRFSKDIVDTIVNRAKGFISSFFKYVTGKESTTDLHGQTYEREQLILVA